jgi:hypothetical protein
MHLRIRLRALAMVGAVSLVLAVAGGVALAAPYAPPDATYLLRSGEQPGFHVKGQVQITPTIAAYVKLAELKGKAAAAATKLLNTAGYAGGADEGLGGAKGLQGFSVVETFSQAAGPALVRNFLINQAVGNQKGGGTKEYRFSVPGVSSARGVTAVDGKIATANVYWTEGSCELGSGLYLPKGGKLSAKAIAAPVIAGVKAQHRRTHGGCS